MKACSEHSQTKSDAHNGRFQGLKFEALVEERVDRDDDVACVNGVAVQAHHGAAGVNRLDLRRVAAASLRDAEPKLLPGENVDHHL